MAKKGKNSSKTSPATTVDVGKKKNKKNTDEVSELEQKKAIQQVNRAKVTSTASWTGKLPHTLLHEFCQKRKWNKVEYAMKKMGDEGMIAIAIISWTDPKSKETLTIKMSDPTYEKASGKGAITPQETPNEARHYAATVALYRVAHNTNMHMMLPPNHKNVWYELSDFKAVISKENPYRSQRLFDSDPFKTLVEDQKLKTLKEKERAGKNKQAEKDQTRTVVVSLPDLAHKIAKPSEARSKKFTKLPNRISFPKKAWDNAPFIDFEESSRQMIESTLKSNIDWNSRRLSAGKDLPKDREALKTELISLKFREAHVEEALSYRDPLSFLLFNLPEDDLPPFFHKRKEDTKNVLQIAAQPLMVRNMIDRLMESGASKDEALFALEASDMSENEAAGNLTQALYPSQKIDSSSRITEQESIEIWNQELESLLCVYENSVTVVKENECYSIDLFEELKLKLKVYRTRNYPHMLPGIFVSTFDRGFKLPDYIKRQILLKLLQYIFESDLLGDILVFHVYEWLQENVKQIIENPGPLLSTTELDESPSNNNEGSLNQIQKDGRRFKSRAQPSINAKTLTALQDEYFKRISTKAYKAMCESRAKLPAWKKQKLIVDLVEENDVVLITGETGSGKSTQVVQFILDSLASTKKDFATKIICTQPRRISAIGLAERVADERCVECGSEVGYVIRGVNKSKATTRIKFMTTGVLVRILQGDKTFLQNTIVAIDEVHERSIDTDLIVILLKNLRGKIPGLKIILMSATVNVDVFKKYFGTLGTCHIEGRTFPIEDHFLDDILDSLDFTIKSDKFQNYTDDGDKNQTLLKPSADCNFFRSGQINYDLICQVVYYADQQLQKEKNDGSIIVFLPGVAEINRCCSMISARDDGGSLVVLPLHSALTPDEQRRVFKRYFNKRKIVVSTNIAETSITIDDCVATIDTGRGKAMIYNAKDNTTRLTESFISKAEAKQRRGRAGRVREGISFKLFSKRLYEEDMASQPEPEIKRISLESLYISVKAMGINDVGKFLREGLDPPPTESLGKAASVLTTVGLLDEFDGSLTELGKFISLMPIMDSKHGKLLVYGIIFGIADIGIMLTSILSVGSMPFVGGFENRDQIKKLMSKNENKGDLIAVCEILQQYLSIKGESARSKFIKENLLSYNKVKEILSSHTQYQSILKDVGFIPFKADAKLSAKLNRNSDNYDIVKAVIAGSFYPQIARVQLPDTKFLTTSMGAIERDPELSAIKFWIRNERYIDHLEDPNESAQEDKPLPATRAFLHPSSVLFKGNNLSAEETRALLEDEQPILKQNNTNALLRNSFVAFNSAQLTSKLYLREITPTSTLSLLLMGGHLSYDVNEKEHSYGIIVDNWLPIRTWCKNAVLIKELRALLDKAIKEKLENPRYALATSSNPHYRADKILDLVEQIFSLD